MAIIKIKYKSTTGSVPSGLCAGELAVNLVDRRLWVGGTTTTSIELAGLSANTFGALNSFNSGISANGATFSGTVTAPTQTVGTNNTTVATTAFVIANALTSSSAVTGVNGFTGAVGISGGQGITIDKLAGNPKIIRSSINYNYGGLTFNQYKLPTDPSNRGVVFKDAVLFQASSSNTFVTIPEEMYLVSLGSFKSWLNGAGSGTFPLTGLTGTETIPILTEYAGDTLTNNYIGITAFQKIILDGGVTSFNGLTGAVTGVTVGGANTFTGVQTFNSGITTSTLDVTNLAKFNGNVTVGDASTDVLTVTSGATFGVTDHSGVARFASGVTVSGRLDVGGVLDVVGGVTFESTSDHAGVARFAAGITTSTIDVTGLAKFNGNVTVGDAASDVLTVTSGATFGVTDHSGGARFASGVTLSSNLDVNGLARFNLGVVVNNGATFSTQVNVAHNIVQTGPTRGISAEGFLYVGGGATFNSSLAVTSIVSPGATLTIQPGNLGVANRTLRLNPYGQLIIDPALATGTIGGSTPRLVVQNTDNAAGQFQFSGGNLYLGTKEDSLAIQTPVNLIFGNSTTAFTTTLTAPNTATSNKTITLPNTTGTVALDANANIFTALQSFTAGISASGGVTFANALSVAGTLNSTGLFNSTGGISASAGITFNGVVNGATASFNRLLTVSGGISASGGVTFNTPIVSTRMARHSSDVFPATITGTTYAPVEADNGRIFVVNVGGKSSCTITFDSLSVGWRAKFISIGGPVYFTSSGGIVVGSFGSSGGGAFQDSFATIVEVICYATNSYYAG